MYACKYTYLNIHIYSIPFRKSLAYSEKKKVNSEKQHVNSEHSIIEKWQCIPSNLRKHTATHCRYRVAWSHRMPYLYTSFSAREPYN